MIQFVRNYRIYSGIYMARHCIHLQRCASNEYHLIHVRKYCLHDIILFTFASSYLHRLYRWICIFGISICTVDRNSKDMCSYILIHICRFYCANIMFIMVYNTMETVNVCLMFLNKHTASQQNNNYNTQYMSAQKTISFL